MRIWIIISSVFMLIFCVPGLMLALLDTDWQGILVCSLLIAIAIHSFYYLRKAAIRPQHSYAHLAGGQFLLGLVITLLMAQMAHGLNNPAFWQQLYDQMFSILAQMQMLGTGSQRMAIEQELQHSMEQMRPILVFTTLAMAALIFISHTLFAWAVWRRGQKTPTQPAQAVR